ARAAFRRSMQRRQGLIGRSSFENVSNRINTSLGHFSRADLGHSWRAPEVDQISRVLRVLATRLQAAIGRLVERARRAVAETVRPSGVATGLAADLFRHQERAPH